VAEDPDKIAENRKKWRRRALVAGVLLGFACHLLPHDYQAPCKTIAKVCSGGLIP